MEANASMTAPVIRVSGGTWVTVTLLLLLSSLGRSARAQECFTYRTEKCPTKANIRLWRGVGADPQETIRRAEVAREAERRAKAQQAKQREMDRQAEQDRAATKQEIDRRVAEHRAEAAAKHANGVQPWLAAGSTSALSASDLHKPADGLKLSPWRKGFAGATGSLAVSSLITGIVLTLKNGSASGACAQDGWLYESCHTNFTAGSAVAYSAAGLATVGMILSLTLPVGTKEGAR